MKKQSLLLLITLLSAAHGRQDPFTVVNNSGETIYVTVHDEGSGNARVCNLNTYYPGCDTPFCYTAMDDKNGWEIRPQYPNPSAPTSGDTCADAGQVCATGSYTGGNLFNSNNSIYVYLRRTAAGEAKNQKSSEWISKVNAGNIKTFPDDFVQTNDPNKREYRDPFKPYHGSPLPIVPSNQYYLSGRFGTITNNTSSIFTLPDYNNAALAQGVNLLNLQLPAISKVNYGPPVGFVPTVENAMTTFNYNTGKITFVFDPKNNTLSLYNWSNASKSCVVQYRLDLNALQKAYIEITKSELPGIPWTINTTFNLDGSLSFIIDVNGTPLSNDLLMQRAILIQIKPALCPENAQ